MVYVDDVNGWDRTVASTPISFRMFADTTDELDSMADRIGIPRGAIAKRGTPYVHYVLNAAEREHALAEGAKLATPRDIALLLLRRWHREPSQDR